MKRKINLKDIECFIFDIDGTLSLGETPIRGANDLISHLSDNGITHYFFTNNSSKNPNEYVKKLNRLGIKNNGTSSIMTSGDVTASYILKKADKPTVYVCGTKALKKQLEEAGVKITEKPDEKIDFAVLGFDTELDYDKITILTDYIDSDVPYIATNIDDVCPIESGKFLVDCGSIAKMIANATGKMPKFLGKPSRETVEYILKRTGISKEKTAIVGDRLYTDMMTAKNGSLISIGVLSGEMTKEDIDKSDFKPDLLFDSVYEILTELIKGVK